jgi:actin-related protein
VLFLEKVINFLKLFFQVVVRKPSDPTTYAWSGGAALAKDPALNSMSVTREEYLEKGHAVCSERYFL